MQSMLERVGTRVLDHLDKPLSTMDLGERGLLALAIARAAIEAMRLECDPFCPVVEAIQTEVDIWPEDRPRPAPNFVQFLSREEAVDIWNAGIAAALK